jgi:hypothetical protein
MPIPNTRRSVRTRAGHAVRLPALLRAEVQASVTKVASYNSNGVAIAPETYAKQQPGFPCRMEITVTAMDSTTGDESYQLTIQSSDDDVSYTPISAKIPITGVGVFQVGGMNFNGRFVRGALTLGGTTPSITFSLRYVESQYYPLA